MKSAEQLLNFIACRIGHIYFRPLMYGGTASGVDLLLHGYHELWAEGTQKRDLFRSVSDEVHAEQDCGAGSFSFRYRRDNPTASEQACAEYVAGQWREISRRLGVPVPYAAIREGFRGTERLQDLFPEER